MRTREIAWLAAGFGIGAVVAALLTTTIFLLIANSSASRADASTQRCFDTLLAATAADDYDQFISVGDDGFRKGITPDMFHSISQSLASRMQHGGCTPTYLGQLRQYGAQVSLWRLKFAGGDDLLVHMSMLSQNRVEGFRITPAF
jgi:hypothetical protein